MVLRTDPTMHRAVPSCQRCRQFGVQCEGYGVRLSWIQVQATAISEHGDVDIEVDVDAEGTSNARASRRALTCLESSPVPRLSSPEIDITLNKIDEWSPGHTPGLKRACFSVFQICKDDSGEPDSDCSPASPSLTYRRQSAKVHEPRHRNSEDITAPLKPPQTSPNSFGRSTQPQHESVPVAQTLLSLGWQDDYNQASDSNTHTPNPSALTHHVTTPSPSTHLDALPMPGSQKRLIHHWVTFTSRKLTLIDEPHNPCRTMMLPMALQGLRSSSGESNANVAIFHALCAAAASNLFELGGRTNDQDQSLALNHEQQAIRHLRYNLSRADNHRDQTFAMAIMACIAADAISGTTQRWRTHVSGGLAYLAKLHSQGVDEAMLAAFRQHMVSMAILCDVPVSEELKSFLNDNSDVQGQDLNFPYYGISRSFLRAYDRMNVLGAAVADGQRNNGPSSSLEKELDAFEIQLYLDFPSLPPQELASPMKTQTLVLHHTSKAFYYAGLVFFQRSIRRATVESVKELVELGVGELESIERAGKGELGCIMLWPVLVLGAECGSPDTQQRMRAWFRSQRKLGFRNLIVLEDLVAAVWEARATTIHTGRNIDWRDLILLEQFDVFRL